MKKWIEWAVIVGLLTWGASANAQDAAAADSPGPKEVVMARYAEMEKIISNGKPVEAMREDIKSIMEEFVDYRELSRLTVKRSWETFSASEKAEFIGLFKKLIQRNYAKRFKPDSSLKVTYEGEAEMRKGKARLRTTVGSGDISADVEYRMHQIAEKTGWWAYDIVIDDVSMMRNYRTQFSKIVKADGKEGLFKKLRKQGADKL